MLDKDEIITVPNTPDYVYTANTDEQDVYKDLGATVCTTPGTRMRSTPGLSLSTARKCSLA